MHKLWQDVHYGLRMLVKRPGWTLAAVITLALGIGANAAIFSVVNAVLLRPLPYKDPQQLALVRLDWRGINNGAGIASAEVLDLRQQTQLFIGFETININDSSLTGDNMEKIPSTTVTEGIFPLLGVQPFLGSGISEPDVGGQKHIWDVVISHELWQRRFGGDPEIIGRKIEVNNQNPMVVGVLPPGFRMHLGQDANIPEQVDLFFLGSLTEDDQGADRTDHDFATIARLKPGVSFAQAQSEIDALTDRLARQYPKAYDNSQFRLRLAPLHNDLVRKIKPALLALLGAVGFVLLIACANVANLVLARTSAREREFAIRCALGAGRRRIIRQLVTENLLLALLGGAGGLLLAEWGVELLFALRPANLPRQEGIHIDGTVLAVTLLVSMLAGVILGVIPAWRAIRADVNDGLKTGSRQSSHARNRLRGALVIAEVALSLMLLVGAGLMIRTFVRLNEIDWGFGAQHLLTLQVSINPRRYNDINRRWQFYQQALEKVHALPGVESVSAATPLPLKGEEQVTSYALTESPATLSSAAVHTVLPDYFSTMGMRLLAGRDFTTPEIEQNLPLALVDTNFAARSWPGENPIGKRLLWRPRSKQPQWLEVIGVVEHVKAGGLHEEGRPQLYLPYLSYPLYDLTLVVRGQTDLSELGLVIKKEVEGLGSGRPVHDIHTMNGYVADQLAETRFTLTLIAIFAGLALSLCLVGLYSVIAHSVSQRTQEIGIRMALGAQASDVLKLVIRQGMQLVLSGIGIGLIGAFALTRLMASLLYGTSATDRLTFIGIALLFVNVALGACYIPARRATKVDPMVALRYE